MASLHHLSCAFVRAMATSQVGEQVLWTTARLFMQALDCRLHVVEGPQMIQLLGNVKFVDLVVSGAMGWQHGLRFSPFWFFPQSLGSPLALRAYLAVDHDLGALPNELLGFLPLNLGFRATLHLRQHLLSCLTSISFPLTRFHFFIPNLLPFLPSYLTSISSFLPHFHLFDVVRDLFRITILFNMRLLLLSPPPLMCHIYLHLQPKSSLNDRTSLHFL